MVEEGVLQAVVDASIEPLRPLALAVWVGCLHEGAPHSECSPSWLPALLHMELHAAQTFEGMFSSKKCAMFVAKDTCKKAEHGVE